MKGKNVSTFGQFHPDRVVVGGVSAVVLGEFCPQASSLYSHHGVDLRIEIVLSAEYFGGDLIFLQRSAGVIHGVFRDIAQELAQRFRTVQNGAVGQLVDFHLNQGPVEQGDSSYRVVTRTYQWMQDTAK